VSPEMTLGLDVREITIGDMLKKAGYATGCVGKWDMGQAKALSAAATRLRFLLRPRQQRHRLLHARALRRAVAVSRQHAHGGGQGHLCHGCVPPRGTAISLTSMRAEALLPLPGLQRAARSASTFGEGTVGRVKRRRPKACRHRRNTSPCIAARWRTRNSPATAAR
jgi:hypothetical protein